MVLLAAAICTKNGKALISRQFVEMTKSRIEGLLSAFPKLMNTGKQHTFVETESVRYVYQPLDKLFMLLITTKASNILEDLETLRLFSRVVPEYCKILEETEILENSFQLLFAFDEIVALGYRENVNLAQIRTFIEMDSHEERVINAVRRTQEIEVKEQMKRKAKELQRAAAGRGKTSTLLSGFGSMSSSMSRNEPSNPVVGDTAISEPSPPKPSYPTRPTGSGKALKLGGKGKDVDSFVDKLRQEGTEVITQASSRQPTKAPTPSVPMSSVHIKVDEKITLSAGRHGGLQNMEVRGMVLLRISDPAMTKLCLKVDNIDDRGFQMQTHPNIDKKLFSQNSVIGLKQSGKGFPLNNEIGVVKWRLQTKDENMIPLTINCWPNENDGQCEVTIEYELNLEDLELNDVTIQIPVPSGVGAPVVGEVTGDYYYDQKKSMLDWQLPVIDASNSQGSLEFSMAGHPDDFYPINVSFYSQKTICKLQVLDILNSESKTAVKYSHEKALTVEKYEVV
ncbi:coatomer subunit delta-like [Rhopilema esculentum]|uniref:coatomer subunit delta-like n=1 Tax=Rhopilema esculentum TaxID=499914 RepID=UPI0031DA5126